MYLGLFLNALLCSFRLFMQALVPNRSIYDMFVMFYYLVRLVPSHDSFFF